MEEIEKQAGPFGAEVYHYKQLSKLERDAFEVCFGSKRALDLDDLRRHVRNDKIEYPQNLHMCLLQILYNAKLFYGASDSNAAAAVASAEEFLRKTWAAYSLPLRADAEARVGWELTDDFKKGWAESWKDAGTQAKKHALSILSGRPCKQLPPTPPAPETLSTDPVRLVTALKVLSSIDFLKTA